MGRSIQQDCGHEYVARQHHAPVSFLQIQKRYGHNLLIAHFLLY